jgi:CcmD family protein
MENSTWLLMANIAIWLGLGGYIGLLAANQKQIEKRIRQMELLADSGTESRNGN